MSKKIMFSPPDISEKEIELVTEALRSGWITTGPKTKEFEKEISKYCGTSSTVCLNSATAALELTLRVLGIGPGDEVITSAYTYTASASVIEHVGAKIVLADTKKDSVEIDYDKLPDLITNNTKVIIPVDIAGIVCDYDKLFSVLENCKEKYQPNNEIQKLYDRVIIMADAAHSFGAKYKSKMAGSIADFTCFSFHAVKNLTTAEGGCVTWLDRKGLDNDEIYKEYQLLSLHGQNKDALSKMKLGSWEYDIVYPAFKCNMTDVAASIGLAQLGRYSSFLKRRNEIILRYKNGFSNDKVVLLDHFKKDTFSSGHLLIIRLLGKTDEQRRDIIEKMAEKGIACNVHYKPLPLLTAYKNMGFDIKDFPNSFEYYSNELTLPLHTRLSNDDVDYVIQALNELI